MVLVLRSCLRSCPPVGMSVPDEGTKWDECHHPNRWTLRSLDGGGGHHRNKKPNHKQDAAGRRERLTKRMNWIIARIHKFLLPHKGDQKDEPRDAKRRLAIESRSKQLSTSFCHWFVMNPFICLDDYCVMVRTQDINRPKNLIELGSCKVKFRNIYRGIDEITTLRSSGSTLETRFNTSQVPW